MDETCGRRRGCVRTFKTVSHVTVITKRSYITRKTYGSRSFMGKLNSSLRFLYLLHLKAALSAEFYECFIQFYDLMVNLP